jgi:hypothetical protein
MPRVADHGPDPIALPTTAPGSAGAEPLLGDPRPDPIEATAAADDAELTLIREAWVAIRSGDALAGLELLREHERRFPSGALLEERLAGRAKALCELGRTAEGLAALEVLAARSPRSPLLTTVREACASGGAP